MFNKKLNTALTLDIVILYEIKIKLTTFNYPLLKP